MPGSRVAVIAGARTPFAKANTVFKHLGAADLATHALDGMLAKHDIDPAGIEQVNFGIVALEPRTPHFAREVVLSSALSARVRALTLIDNCITGLAAVESMCDAIVRGRLRAGIAGGVESLSNPAVLFTRRASRRFINLATARGFGERWRAMAGLRPRDFFPDTPAVAEPSTGLTMGEHCELMVKEWAVGREEQDGIALRSHQRAGTATEDGRLLDEICELDGIGADPLIRPTTTLEKLAGLRPVFDRCSSGTITAGNASPLTDGAACVLLCSEEFAMQAGYEPLAFIKDMEFASIEPSEGLLMAPAVAVPRLLARTGLSLTEMDIVEMHEAFAGQVACNLRAWEQGWKEAAIGSIDIERLNPLGSSLAVGHPFAATGIRLVVTLANEMRRREMRYGLINICGAGATAGAMILERA